jgi:transaldolase
MKKIEDLRVKLYTDGAEIADFKKFAKVPYIKGYTTNPSLMKKAGVKDYEKFVAEVMPLVADRSVSFEVIADDFAEMKRQALKLTAIATNVYVKIPVMNTRRESSAPLVAELSHRGVKLNVTAIMTLEQVREVGKALAGGAPSIVSVFAGRIADTGLDPVPVMRQAKALLAGVRGAELLWASPRELLNLFQADEAGCDIITVQPSILDKIPLVGYDLTNYSHDTVKMFYNDATSSGFKL